MKDVKFEFMRGTGPGGQHKNKKDTACRVTHVPTGTTAYADERSQAHSKKSALAALKAKLRNARDLAKARAKKERRDSVIKDCPTIRTYDFKKGLAVNHTNGKKANLTKVLKKGRIDLLRD